MKSVVKFEPYMAFGPSMEAQIEKQMMELGSGVITDLDRFLMPNLNDCDMDGHEVYINGLGEITRY